MAYSFVSPTAASFLSENKHIPKIASNSTEKMFEFDKDLTPLTTFGIPASAAIFAEYKSLRELTWISRQPEFLNNPVFHMGGGSNLLFTGRYNGLVLRSAIKERTIYRNPSSGKVFMIAGAGEDWPELVKWTVEQGLGGLENLAAIPGQAGASAVQNIGAYGVEASDRIFNVECFDIEKRDVVTFSNEECAFGYRDSKFKHEWKGRYIVLRVAFQLTENPEAATLTYGPLRELADRLGHHPTVAEVAEEVECIRSQKLPDPAETGSAGSFFTNPVVHEVYYKESVLRRCPDVPCYPAGDGLVKIPAGWLIEHAGLKGYKIGGAEVYPKQCLVIANRGDATAGDVVALADHVCRTVREKFGVRLYPEVNYISTEVKVTFLGSGPSKGIPEIGCDCHVCRSTDPHDRRLRASVLVEAGGKTILIDASPDLREQSLRADLSRLDAVLLTHEHYDHVGGLDDLRPLCNPHDAEIYALPNVCAALRRRLDYCFTTQPYPGVPSFYLHEVDDRPFMVDGVKIIPIKANHGKLPVLGFRIGDFAYLTDVKTIDDVEIDKLEGIRLLVLNTLRERSHFAHLNFDEAEQLIARIGNPETYLTHFCHEAGTHAELTQRFNEHIHPAYDGLTLTV